MATKNRGLAVVLRSKIGRVCWFKHPENGEIIEGTYRRGRKVAKLTGLTQLEGGVRGFNVEETVYTVPRHVRITFGQAPAKGGA